MKNLILFLSGLVLINIPKCLSENFYPGGIEDENYSCFSIELGYPCCQTSCEVYYIDEDGDWGIEDNHWCGIGENCGKEIEENESPLKINITDTSIHHNFEFSFLKIENNQCNMLYSPLSIEYALKMLQEGANNNTLNEINEVIKDIELTTKYTAIDKVLSLANGLFIRDTYFDNVKTEYINTLKEKYDADIIKDEFKSAENANQWIENKTLGIIKNMLNDNMVKDPNSLMLIINALAIDMEWDNRFNPNFTSGSTFYKNNGQTMEVTMMAMNEIKFSNIAYYLDNSLTVLTMDLKDYDGIQFEFMAIMPKKKSLSSFVEEVSKELIQEIDKNLILTSEEPDGVNVKIPKFKFDYNLKLKEDLKILGINDVFDQDKADFTRITDSLDPLDSTKKIYVAEALHKADIEFSEKGVKAAAVTVIGMNDSAMPRIRNSVNVTINKPFMFIIRDKTSKDIWFTGTVYEPNLWEDDRYSYM